MSWEDAAAASIYPLGFRLPDWWHRWRIKHWEWRYLTALGMAESEKLISHGYLIYHRLKLGEPITPSAAHGPTEGK